MSNPQKSKLPIIYVLLAGIMWGVIGLFVRRLGEYNFSSLGIVFIRSLSGTLLMGLFLLIYDRKLFRIRLKDVWCFFGTGIVSLTFFNICYFTTISMTSLSIAAILLYTAPSMVVIMSAVIFHERLTVKKIIAVILAFIGCALVTGVLGETAALSGIGILIGLGSGLGYALYSIFARFALNRGYHSFTVTFYTLLFSVFGGMFFAQPRQMISVIKDKPSMVFFLLLFGLISTALPYIFYTLGLKGMESGLASIIASIEPVTATILGIVVFHEHMSLMGGIGVIIVILSIVISS